MAGPPFVWDTGSGPLVFLQGGGPKFQSTLCSALGIRQQNCYLFNGTSYLCAGTFW